MSLPSGNTGRDTTSRWNARALDGLLQARGKRQERLAGAGLAHERHETDIVVQEQIERELLLFVLVP